MRIGVIASSAHRVQSKNDGPWGRIASTLTDGFVARGHDVTLFAVAGAVTSTRVNGAAPIGRPKDDDVDADVSEALHNVAAFERAAEFDVLANHADFVPLTYSRLVATSMVTTIHGLSAGHLPVYRAYDDIARYVAVSDADRRPDLRYDATIHPGVDATRFAFVTAPGEYLLVLGPVHPDNGTHLAIEVAKQADVPLTIAGEIRDETYFRDAVQPHVDAAAVSYRGPVGPDERDALLGGARALLHLVGVAEPFGWSAIEAFATGTPVIATPLGSLPEIVRHASTGFLVRDVSAAVSAVAQLDDLDRRDCRQEATGRFGADRMVEDYLALFGRIPGVNSAHHPSRTKRIGSPGLFSHSTI